MNPTCGACIVDDVLADIQRTAIAASEYRQLGFNELALHWEQNAKKALLWTTKQPYHHTCDMAPYVLAKGVLSE